MIILNELVPRDLVRLDNHGLETIVRVGKHSAGSNGVPVLEISLLLKHHDNVVAGDETHNFVGLINHREARMTTIVEGFKHSLDLLTFTKRNDSICHQVLGLETLTLSRNRILKHWDLLCLNGLFVE